MEQHCACDSHYPAPSAEVAGRFGDDIQLKKRGRLVSSPVPLSNEASIQIWFARRPRHPLVWPQVAGDIHSEAEQQRTILEQLVSLHPNRYWTTQGLAEDSLALLLSW